MLMRKREDRERERYRYRDLERGRGELDWDSSEVLEDRVKLYLYISAPFNAFWHELVICQVV